MPCSRTMIGDSPCPCPPGTLAVTLYPPCGPPDFCNFLRSAHKNSMQRWNAIKNEHINTNTNFAYSLELYTCEWVVHTCYILWDMWSLCMQRSKEETNCWCLVSYVFHWDMLRPHSNLALGSIWSNCSTGVRGRCLEYFAVGEEQVREVSEWAPTTLACV